MIFLPTRKTKQSGKKENGNPNVHVCSRLNFISLPYELTNPCKYNG